MILKKTKLISTLLILAAALFSPQTGWAVSLKKNAMVEGDMITLGDIFSGLSHSEERVLGAAPRPGQEMVLNARTLLRVARALDLPWRPTTTADFIVLRRAATIISRDEIEAGLRDELAMEGLAGKFNLIIPGETSEIVLPQNVPAEFVVENLNLRREANWFEATLVAPSRSNPLETVRLHGKIEPLVDVPVLSAALRAGEVIGKNDIEFFEIRQKDLDHDMVLKSEELIGMTPRRMVLPGKPVKQSEIQAPQIVKRGGLVTMVFETGGMQLSARGKALENGSKGDSIRVVNTGSNRTIEGIVSNVNEVRVVAY